MNVKIFNKSKCCASYASGRKQTCVGNCKWWYAEPNLRVFLYQPYIVYSIYCIRYFCGIRVCDICNNEGVNNIL